uniref:Myb-like domain-containing protein n=1 Tax=Brassica oleracea var. oleracea TaxID=109376 RepID=A0A0D3CJE9_BRAOL
MISPRVSRSPRRLRDQSTMKASSSLSLSSTKLRMISPRLSISILDEIEDDLSSSLCISPRRLRDESLGVSRCRSPRGSWNKPSLSRRLTSLRARALLYEIKSKVAEEESSKLRIAFTRPIQILICFFLSSFTWEMDFNPFTEPSNFVELLSSQQNVIFGNVSDSVSQSSPQVPFTDDSNFCEDSQAGPKERRTWTPSDDVVLISLWLNTSKYPVVGNEQRSNAFWKRIADYFSASRKLAGTDKREASHCKNRWHKINDLVCKFAGAYEAASRERTSGQNENDVLKKWCALSTAKKKKEGSSKKRHCEDGSDSTSYKATEEDSALDDEGTRRPPGVKAAKKGSKERLSKKTVDDRKELAQFETMWSLKKRDLVVKERLSKMKLLDILIAKKDSLADYEEALKKKLIHELMSN